MLGSDLYSLMLALMSGCYCLACLLFLRAFALLLAGLTWWSVSTTNGDIESEREGHGVGVDSDEFVSLGGSSVLARAWEESTALSVVLGADINFDLLFRCTLAVAGNCFTHWSLLDEECLCSKSVTLTLT